MKFIELTAVSGDNVMINLDRVVAVVSSAETDSVVVYTTDGLKENFTDNQSKHKLLDAIKGERKFNPEHGDDKPHANSVAESMSKKYSNGGIAVSNKYREKQAKKQATVDYLIKKIKYYQKHLSETLRQQIEAIKTVSRGTLESAIAETSQLLHDYEIRFQSINDLSTGELKVYTFDLKKNVESLKKKHFENRYSDLYGYISAELGDVISISENIINISRTIELIAFN